MTRAALRKDAALNRERLLAAASELFAEEGLDVTLNDIAHRAGVASEPPTAASPTKKKSSRRFSSSAWKK